MNGAELVFHLSDKATFRSLGDSGVILMLDSGQMYSCNTTAEAFLRRLDGVKTTTAIASEIGGEFDVDSQILLGDMEELISHLLSEEVIVKVPAT